MKSFLCLILIATQLLTAQNGLREIPSTDTAEQQKSFRLADGLEINLFASEPMVRKPIQMAWDARGRLWVASSAIYPHIKPGQTQSDQILILEDTNGDGKADQSTVFYEGLLIPTGIWPQDGGAYVANSTELLFMQDTDGDGKADKTTVLLSGFGTEDTHHILHGIKGGPDGNLYFNQSVYIHSHIETPFGVRRLKGTGIWQYQPRTGRLEVFSMGQVNPWGHIFDDWGQSFTTDGAFGEGINYVFPGATFLCLPNQLPRILKGMNPGQPKQCGLTQISGNHFSAEWQGQLITCDFRGHRVNRFALSDAGSGYRSQQLPDLITSTHGSFRPVDVNMGPDGAIYLADWFNPIIQHGEVDFRDSRRDQVHGRIWRVTMKGGTPAKWGNFDKLENAELLEQLLSSDQNVRYWAKQEIKSRQIANLTALLDAFLVKHPTPQAQAEVLWTAQTCRVATFPWIKEKIWLDGKNDHAPTRAVAVRAMRQMLVDSGISIFTDSKSQSLSLAECEKFFLSLCADGHPRVRLEAVNLLRAWGTPRAIEIATTVIHQTMDPNLDFALWRGCYEMSSTWLPALQRGEISFAENPAGLLFALKAANQGDAANLLLNLIEANQLSEAQNIELLRTIGDNVQANSIDRVLALATKSTTRAGERAAALRAFIVAQNQRQLQPKQVDALLPLLESADSGTSSAAVELAGWWKLEAARPTLEKIARGIDQQASIAQLSLARLGGQASLSLLESLLSDPSHAEQKDRILLALMQIDLSRASAEVVKYFREQQSATPATARLIDSILTRKDGPAVLAAALQGQNIAAEVATQALQKASASGGDTQAFIAALTQAGGLSPVTSLDAAQMTQLSDDVARRGDAKRGEIIYRKMELQCIACHAIGPVGSNIGPNLLSIGSSAPVDYIIESLLLPSKKIKEGYATAMVEMKDGSNFTGFLSREDDKEIQLTDAAGQVRILPMAGVSKKQVIPVSLMPAGLTNSLRRDELTDLIRFLSELGKEGEWKVQEDGTLRQWFVHSRGNFQQPMPHTSLVNGSLDTTDWPIVKIKNRKARSADTRIEVLSDGEVQIRIGIEPDVRWQIDGRDFPVSEGVLKAQLAKGIHTVRGIFPETQTSHPSVRILSNNAKPHHQIN